MGEGEDHQGDDTMTAKQKPGGATAEHIEELIGHVTRWLRRQVGRNIDVAMSAGVRAVKPAPGDQWLRFERTTGGRLTITIDGAIGCRDAAPTSLPPVRTPSSIVHTIKLVAEAQKAIDEVRKYQDAIVGCAPAVKRQQKRLGRKKR
jgi:hypothetical protein